MQPSKHIKISLPTQPIIGGAAPRVPTPRKTEKKEIHYPEKATEIPRGVRAPTPVGVTFRPGTLSGIVNVAPYRPSHGQPRAPTFTVGALVPFTRRNRPLVVGRARLQYRVSDKYLGHEVVKTNLSRILGISQQSPWMARKGERDDLYLAHYERPSGPDAPPIDLSIRGFLVHILDKAVLCGAQRVNYEITLVAGDQLVNEGGILMIQSESGESHPLKDGEGNTYELPMDTLTFSTNTEGVMIRIVKYKGQVIYSSFRNPDARRARISQRSYVDYYVELGGPSAEELFPADMISSDYYYMFLICKPHFYRITKQDLGKGKLIYIGAFKNWLYNNYQPNALNIPEENPHYNIEEIDTSLGKREVTFDGIPSRSYSLGTEGLPEVEEANFLLKYGFESVLAYKIPNDERLSQGEAIIITQYGEQGEMSKVFTVMGPAASWRSEMVAELFDLWADYLNLLDWRFADFETYKATFPLLGRTYDEAKLTELLRESKHGLRMQALETERGQKEEHSEDPAERIANISLCFLVALPPQHQHKALGFYNRFPKALNRLVKWLVFLEKTWGGDIIRVEGPEKSYVIGIDSEVYKILGAVRGLIQEAKYGKASELIRKVYPAGIYPQKPEEAIHKAIEYLINHATRQELISLEQDKYKWDRARGKSKEEARKKIKHTRARKEVS